ncbi:MAG: hypothetical protein KAS01_01880 [Candidatus Pacebacteria bacterium]|nr:hypothetical protein [Candidatus Paceibacterota bacterium]
MKFIKKSSWEEVFWGWKDSEADNPKWIHCATKIKGWSNWESWREHTATQLNLQKRIWNIFEFSNPINEIPKMLIGPFSTWQARFAKKNSATFSDLATFSKEYEHFKSYEKIISILKNQSFDADLIGIVREDTNQIVCIEGHHRAMALAIAKKEGMKINFENPVCIALAKLPKKEIFLLNQTLERGSCKA